MKLSNPKINQISHLVVSAMEKDDNFDFIADPNDVRLRIKTIIIDELKLDDDIDKVVRRLMSAMIKHPPEGSKEWELVYSRMFREEMTKRRKTL